MSKTRSILLAAAALSLLGCSDDTTLDSSTADSASNTTSDTDTDTDTDTDPDGAALYAQHCTWCHGADGEGTNNGPAITEDLTLTDEEIVRIIQEGVDGMRGSNLTTEQAQAIVDWMRSSWE